MRLVLREKVRTESNKPRLIMSYKLKVVEKKKLNEADGGGNNLVVSMRAIDFIKLTTHYEAFINITNFIESWHEMSGSEKKDILSYKYEDRKKIINPKDAKSDSYDQVERLLLGGLAFIRPAPDIVGHGVYDEEKSGIQGLSLIKKPEGGGLIVDDHEGRTRAAYSCLKNGMDARINVTLSFYEDEVSYNSIEDLPDKIYSQFNDGGILAPKTELTAAESSQKGSFRTVEGFMREFDEKRISSKKGFDEFLKDFNSKNSIKVADKDAIVLKTLEPSDSPEYVHKGLFVYGLYDVSVTGIQKPDAKDSISVKRQYYIDVANKRFKDSDSPVTVESK